MREERGREEGNRKMEATKGRAKRTRNSKLDMDSPEEEEEEWDEKFKSIYLLFFCRFFCFSRVHFLSYSPKVSFFVSKPLPHKSFSHFLFFSSFFYYYWFVFPFAIISV